MNLLIIGAARGVGRSLVDMALDRGHRVTGLVRDPLRFGRMRPKLRLIEGDILCASAVAEAVEAQDAVCIGIGIAPTRAPVHVFSAGTGTVLAAMKEARVQRLLCVTGIGAGDSRGHGGILYDRIIQPLLLKTIYADKDRQEALVRASRLAWTLVRPGFLTNGPYTGRYRVVSELGGITATKISRADVADYLLRELASGADMGKAVLVDGRAAAITPAPTLPVT